ncbi:glycoside hydrolase family 16 protein [Butyrivibrio sp. XPD2006]|uniref:glycoside hydrolase family 16 protein n=1 Tax=Butyrivibrio sp. XPD2006 TaxID=1280668 RepID=UPI0003B3855B|nr:glycoside hydrolase family 16 protein [Butyrivibrio sp. XPD2006]
MKKKLLSTRKRNYKTRMAMALAFALTLSLSSPTLTGIAAYAAQVPVNEELAIPFGQMAEYDAEQGIGVVWGDAGYELYTVTISCEANGYEQVYADQTLGYHWYPDSYAAGEYLIEIQGKQGDELSNSCTATVTVAGDAASDGSGQEEPVEGGTGESETGEGEQVQGINVLEKGNWDFWTGEGGAGELTDKGNGDVDVRVDATGWQNFAVQYTHALNLVEGETYHLTGDFYCDEDAVVFINVQESVGWSSILSESPYRLEIKAGEVAHLDITTNAAGANFAENGKLAFMFGDGTGNAGKTITVSNIGLYGAYVEPETNEGGEGSEGEAETPELPGSMEAAFTLDNVNNELTKNAWDFWTGEGGAGTFSTNDDGAGVVKIDAEGGQQWAVQLPQALNLTEGKTYKLSGDFYSEEDAVVLINIQETLGWYSIIEGNPYRLELKGGEVTHLNVTTSAATANFESAGKIALMFGNGTGNAGKTVTIANLALIDTDAAEVGNGGEVSGDNLLTADGWDFWTGEGGAGSITDKGNGDADVKVDAEGGQVYAVQYTHLLNLAEGETYTLEGDFYCEDDAKVFVNLQESLSWASILDPSPYTLDIKGGETTHLELHTAAATANFVTDGKLALMFGNGSGNAGKTITVTNMSLKADGKVPSGGSAEKGNEYDFNNPENDTYNYADPGTSKDGYDLIWADEFDGNYEGGNVDESTGLNLDNWYPQWGDGSTDCGNTGWGNRELQCYTGNSKNIGVNEDLSGDGVGDGVLRITAAYEPGYVYAGESAKNYTSARLRTTKGTEALFSTTYGYVEARMSLPQTAGAWPAFWMLPQSNDIYGNWPVSGEIDIMETCGAFKNEKDNIACGTLHWGVPSHTYKGSGYVDLFSPYTYFHTYAIDWKPGEITWYYDGVAINTLSTWESAISGASSSLGFDAPFDMPFHMLLNLAVDSGQFGGGVNAAAFHDDINMYVDYVRVYQRSDGYADSVTRAASGAGNENWADLAGINQITEIKSDNIETCVGGGMDDAAAEMDKWYLSYQNDATDAKIAPYKDADGKDWAKVTVNTPGSNDYSVQLIGHYNAKKGYVYKVSFDAYGTGSILGKEVNCDAKEWKGWSAYGIQTFKLTNTPSKYSYVFQQTEDFDRCRIEFNLGARGSGDVYVSNVKVEIVDPEEIGSSSEGPREPLANGNIIYNGSFDQGDLHLGFWNATNGTTVVVPRFTTQALKDGDKSVVDVASKTNYENIDGGVKFYERRAQISSENGKSPAVYQPGLNLKADNYTVKFDMFSAEDTVVKASVYSLEMNGDAVALGKELGSAAASYSKDSGVRTYTLTFATKEDAENAALVLTFGKGAGVQLDNVFMKGENQASAVDEYPLNNESGYRGDNGSGGEIALETADGVVTMAGIVSGGTWYTPQLASSDFKLVAGQTYKLSFDYKLTGNSNNTFQYIIQENGGSWHVYDGSEKTVTYDPANGEFNSYERVFTADTTIDGVHLNFGFGNSAAAGDLAFSFKNARIDLVKGSDGGTGSNDAEDVDDDNFDVDTGKEPGKEPVTEPVTEPVNGGETGDNENNNEPGEGTETGSGNEGHSGSGNGSEQGTTPGGSGSGQPSGGNTSGGSSSSDSGSSSSGSGSSSSDSGSTSSQPANGGGSVLGAGRANETAPAASQSGTTVASAGKAASASASKSSKSNSSSKSSNNSETTTTEPETVGTVETAPAEDTKETPAVEEAVTDNTDNTQTTETVTDNTKTIEENKTAISDKPASGGISDVLKYVLLGVLGVAVVGGAAAYTFFVRKRV